MNECMSTPIEERTIATMSEEISYMLSEAEKLMKEIGKAVFGIEPQEDNRHDACCLYEQMKRNVEEIGVLIRTLSELREKLY